MVKSKEGIAMPVPCTLPFIRTSVSVSGFQEDGIFMARFLHQVSVSPKASRNHWILAFFWIVGLLTGILAVYLSGPSLSLLMRRTLDCSVSIARLLSAAFLPFILSSVQFLLLILFPLYLIKIISTKCYCSHNQYLLFAFHILILC